jgi:hypothetical protein
VDNLKLRYNEFSAEFSLTTKYGSQIEIDTKEIKMWLGNGSRNIDL